MVQQLVKKIGHQAVLMDLINKYKQQKYGLQSFAYVCEAGLPNLPEISGWVHAENISLIEIILSVVLQIWYLLALQL